MNEEKLKEFLRQMMESAFKSSIENYRKVAEEYKDESITDIMERKSIELRSIARGYAALNADNRDDVYSLSCLLTHYYLLSDLLTNLFETAEGHSCSVDKAHTVLRYLIRKFSGKPVPNLKEDTFYNPRLILKEEWEILEFFRAFKQFTYGNPKDFLKLYDRLEREAQTHNERAVKRLLLDHLRERYPTAVIVNEYSNMFWRRRADFLVVLEDEIYAVEIKSERDGLSRLGGQVEFFSKNADKVVLFLDMKHSNSSPALSFGGNVEGYFFSSDGNRLFLRQFKEASDTAPPPKDSLLQHWRLGELRLLFEDVIPKAYKKNSMELKKELSKYPYDTVKKLTCGLLMERYKAYSREELKSRKGNHKEKPSDYRDFFVKAREYLRTGQTETKRKEV